MGRKSILRQQALGIVVGIGEVARGAVDDFGGAHGVSATIIGIAKRRQRGRDRIHLLHNPRHAVLTIIRIVYHHIARQLQRINLSDFKSE